MIIKSYRQKFLKSVKMKNGNRYGIFLLWTVSSFNSCRNTAVMAIFKAMIYPQYAKNSYSDKTDD